MAIIAAPIYYIGIAAEIVFWIGVATACVTLLLAAANKLG